MNEELAARHAAGNPVKIGLIGAGQMGVDIVAQVAMMKGIDIVVVADIDKARARAAYATGLLKGETVDAKDAAGADEAVANGKRVFTDDFRVVTGMKRVDVMLEATGVPEIGAKAAILAARHGQQLAMMNVETDITVGPLLWWYARKKGVLYALAAGDEPAACKELYDFAEALGFTIVAAGKGKNNPLDRHAQPTDEAWAKEAARRGLNPNMLIEFVDGSKTMIEMAAVSNAIGLKPDVRGMHGPRTSRDKLHETFALKEHGGGPQPRGRRRIRHRRRSPRRFSCRDDEPSPAAAGPRLPRHGKWSLLHPVSTLPPVQYRSAADLRHARDP
jgi:predicted homoserine dehydrogenase-like protein